MSKKKKNQIGKIFTITGLLLFAAALALSVYNLWDGYRAEQSREKLLEEYRDKNQNISDEGKQAEESDGQIPDYQLNPEMEMPEIALEDLDGAGLDGNAPLTFKVHGVQNLGRHFAIRKATANLDDTVRQRRLTVVDVSDDRKVTYILHI